MFPTNRPHYCLSVGANSFDQFSWPCNENFFSTLFDDECKDVAFTSSNWLLQSMGLRAKENLSGSGEKELMRVAIKLSTPVVLDPLGRLICLRILLCKDSC